jgi:Kef-type K+ transport system membrane component KefB
VTDEAIILLTLGAILLMGLVTDALGRHTPLPRVTLLLIFGFCLGPGGIDLLPKTIQGWFDIVADMALVMVGFLLGGKFTISAIRKSGRDVLWISISAVVITAAVVLAFMVAIGVDLRIALILAGVAPATAPAATADVVKEARAKGPFSDRLLQIVALDDAWGLILFSLLLAAAGMVGGQQDTGAALMVGLREVLGAIVLGVVLGLPAAQLTGRIEAGEPTLIEALGLVFVCGGLSLWLGVSFILAAMVMGCMVANLARHHRRPFHAIEDIEWPFIMLFFVLAGASLDVESLGRIGAIGAAYVLARTAGRLVGGWVGARLSGTDGVVKRWMGLAMMPQAGVALGMALIASGRFPELREQIMALVVGSTVFFELTGPILTRLALNRVGEAANHAKTS